MPPPQQKRVVGSKFQTSTPRPNTVARAAACMPSSRALSHSITGASRPATSVNRLKAIGSGTPRRTSAAHQPKCSLLSTSKISPLGCPASKFGS